MNDTLVANNGRIEHVDAPGFEQFHFEWHPVQQKVWIGMVPGEWRDEVFIPGTIGGLNMKVLAEHCDSHARFLGFVQTYLRGYRQAKADLDVKLKNQNLKVVSNQ